MQERVSWDSQQWETNLLCRFNCLCDHVPWSRQKRKKKISQSVLLNFIFKPYFLSFSLYSALAVPLLAFQLEWHRAVPFE